MMRMVFNAIAALYVKIFSWPLLSRANDAVLHLALRVRGYNNFQNQHVSGERYLTCDFLRRLEPRVCIDVGANVGTYTSLLLQEHSDVTVYAFEPLEGPFKKLVALQQRFGERLIAINKGVGEANETRCIYFNDDSTTHASFAENVNNVSYVNNEDSAEVHVITLDHYFRDMHAIDQIDLLKIDTEGFEYEVLLGAHKLIETCRPKLIQIEYNWHQLFRAKTIYSFSALLPGYKVCQLLSNRLVERDPKHPMANIYEFSNFVFVRADLVHLIQ